MSCCNSHLCAIDRNVNQRVLHDLLRIRLSRRRMIWLLLHPLPLLPTPGCFSFSVSPCVAGRLNDGRGWRGRGMSQIIRRRESLALYKSFNILWVNPKKSAQLIKFCSRSKLPLNMCEKYKKYFLLAVVSA